MEKKNVISILKAVEISTSDLDEPNIAAFTITSSPAQLTSPFITSNLWPHVIITLATPQIKKKTFVR